MGLPFASATILIRRGNHIGQLVRDYEAVEEGTRPVEYQLSGLNAALVAFGVHSGDKPTRRREMSAKSRAKIAAA